MTDTDQQFRDEELDAVEEWNRVYPVGTRVRYWPGLREGSAYRSRTRSTASLLGGHTPVVWVEGHSGCIALTHVEPLPDSIPERDFSDSAKPETQDSHNPPNEADCTCMGCRHFQEQERMERLRSTIRSRKALYEGLAALSAMPDEDDLRTLYDAARKAVETGDRRALADKLEGNDK